MYALHSFYQCLTTYSCNTTLLYAVVSGPEGTLQLVGWGLTALSAQIDYIMPQRKITVC